jgi:hypothetical protein
LGFLKQTGQQLLTQGANKLLSNALGIGGQSYFLSLGSFNFLIDDLPEEIKFGGTQVLAVRQYPGGQSGYKNNPGLDVQVLGDFDDPISWSGTFTYGGTYTNLSTIASTLVSNVLNPGAPSATTSISKALQLNDMRKQGLPLTLKAGQISQQVIISKFSFRYKNDYYVPYEIELQPVANSTKNASKSTATSLLNQALQSTLGNALGTTVGNTITSAITQKVTSITTSFATTTLSTMLFNKASGSPSLANVQTSPARAPQINYTVCVNDTLFSIAKSYYGDGTLWPTIAAANNISNPSSIIAGQKLIIPNQTGS